jgi:hypothetical protein
MASRLAHNQKTTGSIPVPASSRITNRMISNGLPLEVSGGWESKEIKKRFGDLKKLSYLCVTKQN